ncbi:hypothetical protein C9374_012376 [Naegleria lovaniensis]|uniref:Mediator of RNA polymerase II transcription subunit 25 n=1 Tax=Naegleria lovaniensis TaxID=51637 RepID=A0AA88KQU5_NAELO|nr:uncharacterized protein C9374_012376 [Naegleria lovaniensis]KAG2392124.1 hypothetical protein C9374_012376 [Naegleria lovaniensis]
MSPSTSSHHTGGLSPKVLLSSNTSNPVSSSHTNSSSSSSLIPNTTMMNTNTSSPGTPQNTKSSPSAGSFPTITQSLPNAILSNVPKQVCLLIDTTSMMQQYFGDFLKIIQPFLETLAGTNVSSSQQHQGKNENATQKNLITQNVEFGAVLFQNHPPFGDFLVRVIPFVRNVGSISHLLDGLEKKFKGGGVRDTCLAEALAAASTDLQWEKDSIKYCLICSSTPSDHPCTLPGPFVGKPASFIVREMVKKSGVLFSIITPFRSAKWKSIFESSKILSGKGTIGVTVKKENPNSMETENLSHDKLNISNGCFEGTNLSQEVSSKEYIVRLILENAAKVTNTKTLNLLGFKDTFIELRGIVLNPQNFASATSATATATATAGPTTASTTTTAATSGTGNNIQPLLPFTIATKHSPSQTTASSPGMAPQSGTVTSTTKLSPSSVATTTSPIVDSTSAISSPSTSSPNTITTTTTTPENTSTNAGTHQQGVFVHKITLNVENSHLLGSFELYAKSNEFDTSKWPKEYEMKKSVYVIKQPALSFIIKKQIPLCYWKVVSESPKFLQNMKSIISKKFCLVITIDDKKSMIVYPYQIYKAIRKQQPLSTETSKAEPIFVSCVLDTPVVEKLVERISMPTSSTTANPAATSVPNATSVTATNTAAGTATLANPATLAPTIVKPPTTTSSTPVTGIPPGMPIGLYPFPYMIPTTGMVNYGQFMLGMPNLTPMPTGNISNPTTAPTTNTATTNNITGSKK